jgi:hypothetical protein
MLLITLRITRALLSSIVLETHKSLILCADRLGSPPSSSPPPPAHYVTFCYILALATDILLPFVTSRLLVPIQNSRRQRLQPCLDCQIFLTLSDFSDTTSYPLLYAFRTVWLFLLFRPQTPSALKNSPSPMGLFYCGSSSPVHGVARVRSKGAGWLTLLPLAVPVLASGESSRPGHGLPARDSLPWTPAGLREGAGPNVAQHGYPLGERVYPLAWVGVGSSERIAVQSLRVGRIRTDELWGLVALLVCSSGSMSCWHLVLRPWRPAGSGRVNPVGRRGLLGWPLPSISDSLGACQALFLDGARARARARSFISVHPPRMRASRGEEWGKGGENWGKLGKSGGKLLQIFRYWCASTAKKCQRRPTKIVKLAGVKSFVLNTALILKGAEKCQGARGLAAVRH